MTIACRRCVVVFAALAWVALAAGCTGDDDPPIQSLATAETAPPGSADGADSTTSTVAGQAHLGDYTTSDPTFGTEVTVTLDQGLRVIEANAIPDHPTGQFPNPGNPNAVAGQQLRYEFPTSPRHLGRARPVRVPAVAINGVPFEPGTAEEVRCASGERYQIEALQGLYDLGLDANRAHVQPSGLYHYHGLTDALVQSAESTGNDLVHVGFAADGFLVYASTTSSLQPSYQLSTEPRTGTGCTYRDGEIAIEGTIPDGTYVSDWVNDPATGDLDACNGVTLEDEYGYLVTEAYPFVPRCLMGAFTEPETGGPGASGAGGGDGSTDPDDDIDEDESADESNDGG